MKTSEKLIITLCAIGGCILGLYLLFQNEAVQHGLATFFGGVWIAVQILFWLGVAFGVIFGGIRAYQMINTRVVHDKKDQPVRAIVHRGELVQIAPTGIDANQIMQQLAHMKQMWQMLSTASSSMKNISRFMEDYEVVDTDGDEEEEEIEGAAEVKQIEAPSLNPENMTAPSFREELESGLMEPGQKFTFGYLVVTDPYTHITSLVPITDAHTRTMFLAGWSGTGKSTLVAGVMARRARIERNVVFLVLDPHKGADEDSLTIQIAEPFADWLIRPKGGDKITGKKISEVRAAISFLKQEIELKLERTDLSSEQKRQMSPYFDLDIWVIVDEVLSYARETRIPGHDPVFDELMHLLQKVATDGRKVGITGIYMTQLSTKEQLGDVEIKDACPRRVILSMPRDQGKALGLTGPEANVCERFPQGRGYYKTNGMDIFVWGYGSPKDIAKALDGVQSPLVANQAQANMIYLSSRLMVKGKADTLQPLSLDSQDDADGGGENGSQVVPNQMENTSGNQIESAPQALSAELDGESWQIEQAEWKIGRILAMLDATQEDQFKAIWQVVPGKGEKYKKARAERTAIYRYIQGSLRNWRETSIAEEG
jgi:hypothetical protein